MVAHLLRAGVAEVDITPPMGVEMSGYGPYEKRVCTEVLDPLFARALWLEAGAERLLIVTLDLITIDLPMRKRMVEAIHRTCDIADRAILIAASHTHSGPAVQRIIGWGECDAGYLDRLPGLVARVAAEAQDRALPARLGACRQRVHGIGINRDQPTLGPLDTAAQLLRLDTMGGRPLAVLFNIGAHCVARYPYTSRISADWPGLATAYIQSEMPGATALFLQGCLGNINAHEMSFRRDDVILEQKVADMRTGDVAIRLVDQILPALRAIETRPQAALSAAWRMLSLPCTAPDPDELQRTIERYLPTAERRTLAELRPLHERIGSESEEEKAWRDARYQVDVARQQLALLARGEMEVPAPVQVLRIGEAAIAAWPAEIYVELGLELRQRSPIPLTFVAGLANDTVGYIPSPAAYESQGQPNEFGLYPTRFTPRIFGRLPFRPDVGRILVEETLDVMRNT